jgi:hypothetical protein
MILAISNSLIHVDSCWFMLVRNIRRKVQDARSHGNQLDLSEVCTEPCRDSAESEMFVMFER